MSIKPILGTMNFGPQVGIEDSLKMVELFLSKGFEEFDTAFVYNNGDSEKYLGNALKNTNSSSAILATKVNPRISGKLDRKSITDQLQESLSRLDVESIDILYLHFPDPTTPLSETLECCSELHEKGYFKELGLSNYPAWEVVHIWHLCKANGWLTPSVYQGLYNGLSRNIETELIPALRELGMRFYAYNPLAGGILSGKYSDIDTVTPGRFTHRPNYKGRYWKKEFFEALSLLNQACENSDITIVEASFRWLTEHSQLDETAGDSVLIGTSCNEQLKQNLSFFGKGKLEQSVIDAFDSAWDISKAESPTYFRTVG
ncbi:MAG: aflatoxin B1 aldehyde reductase [Paraglaciecola sp.]|jgi:aflatoxin B1 aldehyde reductase